MLDRSRLLRKSCRNPNRTAKGEVRVLNVVRGLGHGLDESALRAVEHIKFKPAQRDGQPADSTATVHIVFQLAY
jgi:TonB family protein